MIVSCFHNEVAGPAGYVEVDDVNGNPFEHGTHFLRAFAGEGVEKSGGFEFFQNARRGAHDLPAFVHVLTHKDLHLHPVQIDGGQPQGDAARWFDAEEWSRLGLPAPMRKMLEYGEA